MVIDLIPSLTFNIDLFTFIVNGKEVISLIYYLLFYHLFICVL